MWYEVDHQHQLQGFVNIWLAKFYELAIIGDRLPFVKWPPGLDNKPAINKPQQTLCVFKWSKCLQTKTLADRIVDTPNINKLRHWKYKTSIYQNVDRPKHREIHLRLKSPWKCHTRSDHTLFYSLQSNFSPSGLMRKCTCIFFIETRIIVDRNKHELC